MQGEQRVWWFTTARLITTVAVGVFCGWIFGNVWVGLAVALASHLAWQLVNLFRLDWWVRHRSFADPPEFGGVWGEVVTQVVRLHRRKRYHKQRFVKLVRQIQRSTAALPDGVATTRYSPGGKAPIRKLPRSSAMSEPAIRRIRSPCCHTNR